MSRYPIDLLREIVARSHSFSEVLRHLGHDSYSGGTSNNLRHTLQKHGIDYTHFTGKQPHLGKSAFNRKSPSQILQLRTGGRRTSTTQLRRAMLASEVPLRCAGCGVGTEWNGRPLVLDIDHINGNWLDDRLENLQFLCPNCHSQRSTSKSRRRYVFVKCSVCDRSFRSQAKKDSTPVRKFCGHGCASKTATRPEKGSWPEIEVLRQMVWAQPLREIAIQVGVSDVAVKKRCKRLGIDTPPMGYWAKSCVDNSGASKQVVPAASL